MAKTADLTHQPAVRFVRADPERLFAHDAIISLWAVVSNRTDQKIGYVASSARSYISPTSGKLKTPVRWGYAIHEDEFRSGIQFDYETRHRALASVLRVVTP